MITLFELNNDKLILFMC